MGLRSTGQALFDLRRGYSVTVTVYAVALFAWILILTGHAPMPKSTATAIGISDPGGPEALALSEGPSGSLLYLLMWGTMMIAMMYPSTTPLVRLYYKTVTGTRVRKALYAGAFLGTYTIVWTATGVVPLFANQFVSISSLVTAHAPVPLAGALLLLSVYQLSPFKHRCLDRCRSPLGFLMQYHRPGLRGAVRTSLRHSAFCVGCCWALFVFMIVVGSMNLVWMAIVGLVVSLERLVPWGSRLAVGVGVLAGLAGAVLLAVSAIGYVA